MKSAIRWVSTMALFTSAAWLLASCGGSGGGNPCADGALPPITCGLGACSVIVDACDAAGQPVECTPGEAQDADICGDGLDNDCDGTVDEDDCSCGPGAAAASHACYRGSAVTRSIGLCQDGVQSCANGEWAGCDGDVQPAEDIADGMDNDCDGEIDEDFECSAGSEQPCYGGPAGTVDVGPCMAGVQTCNDGQWGECTGQSLPAVDACDGIDNDCDGAVDNVGSCP